MLSMADERQDIASARPAAEAKGVAPPTGQGRGAARGNGNAGGNSGGDPGGGGARPPGRKLLRNVIVALALIGGTLAGLAWRYGGTDVPVPGWVQRSFEARASAIFPRGRIKVGRMAMTLTGQSEGPVFTFRDVVLTDAEGNRKAVLNRVAAVLDGGALLRGVVKPRRVILRDTVLLVERDSSGRFDIDLATGPGLSADGTGGSVPGEHGALSGADHAEGGAVDLVARIEAIFSLPALQRLHLIETTGTTILFDDRVSGRKWRLSDGQMQVERKDAGIGGFVRFQLKAEGRDEPAHVTMTWEKPHDAPRINLETRFSGVSSADLADQVPAVNWLRAVDAPIAGSFRLTIDNLGLLGKLDGVLDVGEGRLIAGSDQAPSRFRAAKLYLSFDPERERLDFSQISVDTDLLSIEAEGHAYLSDRIDRTVGALIGQLRVRSVLANPPGLFEQPLQFSQGAIDLRLRLDPLRLDIGQLVLTHKDMRLHARGHVGLTGGALEAGVDLSIDRIDRDILLAMWPLTYKPQTRDWMAQNVNAGVLVNVNGALRLAPGGPPRIHVTYDMEDFDVRYIRALPPVRHAGGYGVLTDRDMTISVERGWVTAPTGKPIDVGGSRFTIPDIRIREAPARVDLTAEGEITPMLALLDMPPFSFLSKGGVPVDIAEGHGRLEGVIGFPLKKIVTFDDVTLSAQGEIRDVRSDRLVAGKLLAADLLRLRLTNEGVTVSGDARLGQLPVRGLWHQRFGKEFAGRSTVEGQLELSKVLLDEFSITLPEDALEGAGVASLRIALRRGQAPRFELRSDLNRVTLRLSALGWSKPRNRTGSLEVKGRFGQPASVDSLVLRAEGLDARGSVSLRADGGLDVARFERVRLGGWLDAPIQILGRGAGKVAIAVMGGAADFRRARFGRGTGEGVPVAIRLDELTVTSGIRLTGLSANLDTSGGVSGRFTARVNGQAPISGTLAPQGGGVGVRVLSDDAGKVLRATGIFSTGVGGKLDMAILPTREEGVYKSAARITGMRVRNAPALAELLSAISVVGLLDQLSGDGITFTDIDGKFIIRPDRIEIVEGSAIGPSMGITMTGTYDSKRSTMKMEGVITPLYLVNGIFEQTKLFGGLLGRKQGEGVFGFNYRMTGPIDDPAVSVNPLSILTPGALRDLFRGVPPAQGGAMQDNQGGAAATQQRENR